MYLLTEDVLIKINLEEKHTHALLRVRDCDVSQRITFLHGKELGYIIYGPK